MNNRKKLLLVLFFSITACILAGSAYFVFRFLLFNKGLSLSDLFYPDSQPSFTTEINENTGNTPILGITHADLQIELESAGFFCSEPELSENNLYRWVCWKEAGNTTYQEVFIFSRSMDNIDFLDMNITQSDSPSDQVSLDYFLQIINIVAPARTTAAVKNWIDQTLPDIDEIRELKEADFGNIHYRLYGLPEARSLEIGILPD